MNKLIIIFGAITFMFMVPLLTVAGNQTRTELEGELIAAGLFCFGLERLLFQIKEDFKSQDDVYKFFRQGFGSSLAEKLTKNIWNDNQVKLKDGDQVMESPDNMLFKSITEKFAVISFKTPKKRQHIWGNSETTELLFKKEGGRWKLFKE